jgi:NADP-dependent 3-hydroxy acid dehydrogenase YdfG
MDQAVDRGTENTSALLGRTALVTGASRGIGAAVARALASRGVRVALVARNAERLNVLAAEIGRDAFAVPCDLTDRSAVQQMAESVNSAFQGAPDILVNNAGVFGLAPLHEVTEELFSVTVQTNLIAPFSVIRAFLSTMRARGAGDIVTIGSVADRTIMPENGAYSAAKYGLRAMHEVLRQELRGSGVRASLISPAAVDTELWDELLKDPGERMLPTRDVMLAPTAVADAVVYVVSQPRSVNIDELRLSRS